VQENAVASLLNLSKHPGGRAALFEAGGVGLVVDVINVGARAEARQNAAAVLFYLSSDPEHAEEIGRIPESIPTLVQLIRDGAHRGRKNAMVSLYGLLQCASNHGKAVAAGAVAALAALLFADCDDLAGDAVTLLARLAEHPTGAQAVLARPGLVAHVVEALAASVSRSGKDHCAVPARRGEGGGAAGADAGADVVSVHAGRRRRQPPDVQASQGVAEHDPPALRDG
jgi:hypothetical protein